MSERRLISFNSHIIEDVVKKSGGKYTYEQVEDVFNASTAFVINLMKYSDVMEVNVHPIGRVKMNLDQAKGRAGKLRRYIKRGMTLSKQQEAELEMLDARIKEVQEYLKDHKPIRNHMLFKSYKYHTYTIRKGDAFAKAQKIQEQEFK